ncbi:MAG: glycosyltransferase, partial [SAR324 cluster bacterium]|nr:glycosyltransferase [SAR324 cluster bacterium]
PIPANAIVSDFVPHGAVLENAGLVLSHAGHGIVMKSLYYGVPMVLVPWARDQFGVARRAEALGVAEVVRREDCSGERVAAAVNRVFADDRYARKASEISRRLRTEKPADRACRYIEELLRQDM